MASLVKWNAHTKKKCPQIGTYIHQNEFNNFNFQLEGRCRLTQAALYKL